MANTKLDRIERDIEKTRAKIYVLSQKFKFFQSIADVCQSPNVSKSHIKFNANIPDKYFNISPTF